MFLQNDYLQKEYFVWNKKQFLLNPINSKTSLLKKKKEMCGGQPCSPQTIIQCIHHSDLNICWLPTVSILTKHLCLISSSDDKRQGGKLLQLRWISQGVANINCRRTLTSAIYTSHTDYFSILMIFPALSKFQINCIKDLVRSSFPFFLFPDMAKAAII